MRSIKKASPGFTLIEILVVIGIIAVLAAIVIIAINPARQFAQARNAQRTANVNAILNSIGQRLADNKGIFAGAVTGTQTCAALANGAVLDAAGTGNDLSCLVPTYIPTLPRDPEAVAGSDTSYDLTVDASGRVTICAPEAVEPAISGSVAICVTR